MPQVQVVIPDPQGPVQLIIPEEPRIVKIVVQGLTFGGLIPTDVARLSLPNVFQRENTFPALRLTPRLVTADYQITHLDGEIVVNAEDNDVTLTLPDALATGQMLRITRIDGSLNTVTVAAKPGDMIGNLTEVNLDAFLPATFDDIQLNLWNLGLFLGPFVLPDNIAFLNQNNFFTLGNSFSGINLSTRVITADYTVTSLDFAIYADCSAGPISVYLPPALATDGRGQLLRFEKIDDSDNVLGIYAQPGDLISGSASLFLGDQWADAQLFEAAPQIWDNAGSASSGGGGADFGSHGRVVDLFPLQGFSFEVWDESGDGLWHEQARYTEPGSGPTPVASQMWVWFNGVNNKTDLAAIVTADTYAVGSRVDADFQADPDLGSGLKTWVLRSGAADGADPGQVAPDDYNAGTNDVHWELIG